MSDEQPPPIRGFATPAEIAELHERVDVAVGNLDTAVVDLAGRLEAHVVDDAGMNADFGRLRECVAELGRDLEALRVVTVDLGERVEALEGTP